MGANEQGRSDMERQMYERSYGYKYKETSSGHAPDIAKLIRQDIKQAIAEGLLRADAKYSVTSETFSGGQSIDIRVKDWTDAWVECDGTVPGSKTTYEDGTSFATSCNNVWCKGRDLPEYRHAATVHYVLNEEAQAAKMTLNRIHGAYNHDGSDIQTDYFDVRYYGHVEFEDRESAEWRAKEEAKKNSKRAAIDEQIALGNVHKLGVRNRQGRETVHLYVEIDGKRALVCGAQLWRTSLFGKTDGEVSCSRCKKHA